MSRIAALFGTQYQNAALRAVPPSSGAFSRSTTSLPTQRANRAAGRPPPPPPTTTMSASTSNGASAETGAAEARGETGLSFMANLSSVKRAGPPDALARIGWRPILSHAFGTVQRAVRQHHGHKYVTLSPEREPLRAAQ